VKADGGKATGFARVAKYYYSINLELNVLCLVNRMKNGSYQQELIDLDQSGIVNKQLEIL